jgi:hypothetical protein
MKHCIYKLNITVMAKPILEGENPVKIIVDLEWLVQFAKAIDRNSYSCGGIFTSESGHQYLCDTTLKLVQMDVDELKQHSR